jgi:predicted HTH domain antitoxin
MKRVEFNLPDEIFASLDRDPNRVTADLRAAAAAKLYELGRVSQEVAAQIAGVSRTEFVAILSELRVSPMQESADEARAGAELLRKP